jgi:hypothetical protein
MNTPICPRCGGAMEDGFLVDHTYGHQYGPVAKAEWASGEPKYSQWSGMKMKGRQRYNVVTYRCMRCGVLEAYARDLAEEDHA